MPKLQEYSAKAIYKRTVVGECEWPLKRIEKYLEKHNKKCVDALWIAKRRDVKRVDKLWVLICRAHDPRADNPSYPEAHGLAPFRIREKIIKSICVYEYEEDNIDNDWREVMFDSKNTQRGAMKLVIKLLEEHERK